MTNLTTEGNDKDGLLAKTGNTCEYQKTQSETKECKNQSETQEQKKSIIGACCALFLCFTDIIFFNVSFLSAQYLSGSVPENELNSLRFLATVLMAAPFLVSSGGGVLIPKSKWHIFLACCLLSIGFNSAVFNAAIYIPAGTVVAIDTGTAIIVIAMIKACIDRDLRPRMYIGAFISVIGILFLIQPQFLMFPVVEIRNTSWSSPCKNETVVERTKLPLSDSAIGYCLAVTAGITTALYFHTVKYYIVDGSNPFALTMWRSVAAVAMSAALMVILERPTLPTDIMCVSSLLFHVIGMSAHGIVIPFCLKYLSPSGVSIIKSLNMVSLVVLQYTLMRDVLPPKENWLEVLGALLCFTGSLGGTLYEIVTEHYSHETIGDA